MKRGHVTRILKLSLAAAMILAAQNSLGVNLALVDLDNTQVETRYEFGGTFQTPFVLFRIERPGGTIFQGAFSDDQIGPERIEVPAGDFQILSEPIYHALTTDNLLSQRGSSAIGLGDGRLGSQLTPYTLSTGQSFIPGFYRVDIDRTFRYFFTDPSGEFHLLSDFERAYSEDPQAWKGPLWSLFAAFAASPDTVSGLGTVTARGHEHPEWDALYNAMIAKGELLNKPPMNHVHAVSRPEYLRYDRRGRISHIKVGVYEDYMNALKNTQLGPDDMVLGFDGVNPENLHTLIFADDNPEIVRMIIEKARTLMSSGLYPVKPIILNAGSPLERDRAPYVEAIVVKRDGTPRPLVRGEIAELLSPEGRAIFHKSKKPRNCLATLKGVRTEGSL